MADSYISRDDAPRIKEWLQECNSLRVKEGTYEDMYAGLANLVDYAYIIFTQLLDPEDE